MMVFMNDGFGTPTLRFANPRHLIPSQSSPKPLTLSFMSLVTEHPTPPALHERPSPKIEASAPNPKTCSLEPEILSTWGLS